MAPAGAWPLGMAAEGSPNANSRLPSTCLSMCHHVSVEDHLNRFSPGGSVFNLVLGPQLDLVPIVAVAEGQVVLFSSKHCRLLLKPGSLCNISKV